MDRLKKPPDIPEFVDWYDSDFVEHINLPSKKDKYVKVPNIINSKFYTLQNNFDDFKFRENSDIPITDVIKLNLKIKKISKNSKLSQKQKDFFILKEHNKIKQNPKYIGYIIKTDNLKLSLNNEQRNTILKWIKISKSVYNYCVDDFMKDRIYWLKNNKSYKSYKLIVFKDLFGSNKKGAPYDILTDEVKVFCSNIKSCESNLKEKNIEHYDMHTVDSNNLSKSIGIPKKAISKKGIFSRLLGTNNEKLLKKYIKNKKNVLDSRLVYSLDHDIFYLKLVQKEKKSKAKMELEKEEFVSLDGGEKIFYTIFGSNGYGFFGKDMHLQLLYIRDKIARWTRILAHNKNKKNGKLNAKNKKKIRKRIRKLYKKIINIVKELHNKFALYLCKKYKKIIIPEFKVSEMIKGCKKYIKSIITELEKNKNDKKIKEKNIKRKELIKKLEDAKKKNRLSRKVKFVLLSLSHYKFKQHLMAKCQEYGCELDIVTEEYTTMTCVYCGKLSKNYKGRIKVCTHCKKKIHRDINGAINIFIKNRKIILYEK